MGPTKLPILHCQRDVEVPRITLKENTTIPANHKVIFPAEIEAKGHPSSIEGVVEPDASFVQKTGLLVGHVLAISANQHIPVRLLNLSNSEVKIYKGMHIGTFHPLQNNVRDELNTTCVSAVSPGDKKLEG